MEGVKPPGWTAASWSRVAGWSERTATRIEVVFETEACWLATVRPPLVTRTAMAVGLSSET